MQIKWEEKNACTSTDDIFSSKSLHIPFFCSNFGRRLAYGNSPEITFALTSELQLNGTKNSFIQA